MLFKTHRTKGKEKEKDRTALNRTSSIRKSSPEIDGAEEKGVGTLRKDGGNRGKRSKSSRSRERTKKGDHTFNQGLGTAKKSVFCYNQKEFYHTR